jgi:hypothetical protein
MQVFNSKKTEEIELLITHYHQYKQIQMSNISNR